MMSKIYTKLQIKYLNLLILFKMNNGYKLIIIVYNNLTLVISFPEIIEIYV